MLLTKIGNVRILHRSRAQTGDAAPQPRGRPCQQVACHAKSLSGAAAVDRSHDLCATSSASCDIWSAAHGIPHKQPRAMLHMHAPTDAVLLVGFRTRAHRASAVRVRSQTPLQRAPLHPTRITCVAELHMRLTIDAVLLIGFRTRAHRASAARTCSTSPPCREGALIS